MTPLKLYPLRARVLIATTSLVFLAFGGGTFADSPPGRVSIRPDGTSAFTLEWNAVPDASYKIQGGNFGDTPGLNGGDMIWKTIDLVTPSNNVGSYRVQIPVVPAGSPGAGPPSAFYRLVLPQSELFSVEPAIVASDVPVDLYLLGQCFSSNDVLRLIGPGGPRPLTNREVISPLLIRIPGTPSFTPDAPGTYGFELVSGSTGQTSLLQNAWTVLPPGSLGSVPSALQGPPVLPPGVPMLMKAKEKANRTKCSSNLRTAGKKLYVGNLPFSACDAVVVLGGVKTDEESFKSIGELCDDNDRDDGCDDFRMHNWPGQTSLVPFSGEIEHRVIDMFVPGVGIDFLWERVYSSRTGQNSPMGTGWDFSYNIYVEQSGGDILLHSGDGREDRFYLQPDGTFACNQHFYEMTLGADQRVKVKFPWLGEWEFNPFDGSTSAGKISSSHDTSGNTMTFAYNGLGQLTEIVDTLGRAYSVAYNSDGFILSLTDFAGDVVQLNHHGNSTSSNQRGWLDSVTCPAVTGTPNGNDFPLGKTMSYTYTTGSQDERLNNNLSSITDPSGQTWLQVVYRPTTDPANPNFDAVDYMQRGAYRTKIRRFPQTPSPANQYAVLKCVLNDGAGDVSEMFFDSQNRCVRLLEYTGRANPDQPTTETQNRPLRKLRAEDPDYFETRWTWNLDSLCTSMTLPRGNSVRCLYERDFDRNAQPIKKGDARVVRELPVGGIGADTDGDGIPDLVARVWRFEYDPDFGSPGLPAAITKRNAITATQQNEAAAMRQGDIMQVWGSTHTLPVVEALFNHGPRQTIPLDDHYSSASKRGAIMDNQSNEATALKSYPRPSRSSAVAITDDASFATSITDPRGLVTESSFDRRGKVYRRVLLQQGRLMHFGYNDHGQLTSVTNAPDGNGLRRVDTLSYYDSGPQAGYLRDFTVDAQGPTVLRTTYEHDSRGNVTRCIDPNTNDWLYAYNALDQLVQSSSAMCCSGGAGGGGAGGGARYATQFTYDLNDKLTQMDQENRDETGALGSNQWWRTQFQYDALNRMTSCWRDKNGALWLRCNSVQYDANDNVALYRSGEAVNGNDPNAVIQFLYDERNLLYWEIRAPGTAQQSSSQYDYSPNATKATPWKQHDIQGLDAPTLERATITYTYDGFDRPLTVADAMGNVTMYAFDANNNPSYKRIDGETEDVAGSAGNKRYHEWRWTYNALDLPLESHGTFFDVATQNPIGSGAAATSWTYAPNGLLLNSTDDNGHATSYDYDRLQRVSRITDAKGNHVDYAYDNNGNTITSTQTDRGAPGSADQIFVTTCVFDNLNRRVRATDSAGNVGQDFYDSRGNLVRQIDPNGIIHVYEYDGLSRKLTVWVDKNGDGTMAPSEMMRSQVWDDNDRLVSSTDNNGNTTLLAYDSLDRLVLRTLPDGTSHQFAWDTFDDLVTSTDANATVVVRGYDRMHRLLRNTINIPAGSAVAATTTFEEFTYDCMSHVVRASNDVSMLEYTYDSLGNIERAKQDCLAVYRTYDGVGNCLSMTYPSGRIVLYSYDELNRVTAINSLQCSACISERLATYSYEGPDRLATITRGNGVGTRINWDGAQNMQNEKGDFGWKQVSRINHTRSGGAIVDQRAAAYDRNQNKTSRTQLVAFVPGEAGQVNIWAYTPLNQLKHAINTKGTGTAGVTDYELDGQGNRLSVTQDGIVGAYTRDATIPEPADFQVDQYSVAPTGSHHYDRNGNRVSTSPSAGTALPTQHVYDYANRLVEVDDVDTASGALIPVMTFSYDAFGHRISKTTAGSGVPVTPLTTYYLYGGGDDCDDTDEDCDGIIEVRQGDPRGPLLFAPVGHNPLNRPAYRNFTCTFINGRLAAFDGAGQLQYYYHSDELGNVLALTDAKGNVLERYDYSDYGAPTFMDSDGKPMVGPDGQPATSSSQGNPFLFHGMFWDAEKGYYFGHSQGSTAGPLRWNNDPYAEDSMRCYDPQTGRYITRSGLGTDWGETAYTFANDNPWSAARLDTAHKFMDETKGGGASRMKTGTVKFFNESKGFGFIKAEDGQEGAIQANDPAYENLRQRDPWATYKERHHTVNGHVTLMK